MKKIFISLILLCTLVITPVHAKEFSTSSILITSEHMQYIFLVSMSTDSVQTAILPKNVILPIPCLNNEPYALHTIDCSQVNCFIDSIENAYHTKIKNYVILNEESFKNDFNVQFSSSNTKDILTAGTQVKNQLSMKDLMHYKNYIHTDLTTFDLINLYKEYTSSKKALRYYYSMYLNTKKGSLPLTTELKIKN